MNKKSFNSFLKLLTPAQRRKGVSTTFLLALNSLLDFVSIASFLPLIFLIINPAYIATNSYVKGIYDYLDVDSYRSFIFIFTSAIIFLVIAKNLISLWIAKTKAKYAYAIGKELSSRALNQYMHLNYHEFTQADHSRELNRIAHQPLAFANNIVIPVATLFSEMLTIILIITAIGLYNWKTLILLTLIVFPVSLAFRLRKKSLKKISSEFKEKHPRLLKYALQVIEGLLEIKSLAKESFFKHRFKNLNDEFATIFVREHTIQTSTIRLTEIVALTFIGLLIIYAVLLQQNYQQTIFLLSVYASASFRIIPSFNRILNAMVQLRIHEYLLEELSTVGISEPAEKALPQMHTGFTKKIEIKNISFSYPGRPRLLKSLSFSARKGEKIAIIGKSGNGKTTLLLILLGFIKGYEGEIIIDDRPAKALIPSVPTGYVPQNPYIADGSIADNIAFGISENEMDVAKIEKIIHSLGLSPMMDELKDGTHTKIGEKGIKLSGGQRQRLAIARALYNDAEILLLDEITNNLDWQTEEQVMQAINSPELKNTTVILITHRSQLLKSFDAVYELKDGRCERYILHNNSLPV